MDQKQKFKPAASKNPLKRPPFSKGYLNSKVSDPNVDRSVKNVTEKNVATSKVNVVRIKPQISAQASLTQKSVNVPPRKPILKLTVKTIASKVKESEKNLSGKNVLATRLDQNTWDSIVQWCQLNNGKSDNFSPFQLPGENKKTASSFRPACRTLLDVKDSSIEKRLELLHGYLKKQNFPSNLMIKFLLKEGEVNARLKEYSLFWIILADCKSEEQKYKEVLEILKDAYKAKAKPPGRLIEFYESFLETVMQKIKTEQQIAEIVLLTQEIELEEQQIKTEEERAETETETANARTYIVDNDLSTQRDVPVVQNEFSSCQEIVDSVDSNSVCRKSVGFAEPLEEQQFVERFQTPEEQLIKFDESVEEEALTMQNNVLKIAESAVTKSGHRRTNVLDEAQIFLSSQRKFALLSEKKNEDNQKRFLTPVRRSTRVDQENLPEVLREKLDLFDSPSEIVQQNCEMRRNPALRMSFGGNLPSTNKANEENKEI